MLTDRTLSEARGRGVHVAAVAGEVDVDAAPELRSALIAAIERGEAIDALLPRD